jgi:hypothetical protein
MNSRVPAGWRDMVLLSEPLKGNSLGDFEISLEKTRKPQAAPHRS